MFQLIFFFSLGVGVCFGDAGSVVPDTKCDIQDEQCRLGQLNHCLHVIATDGAPELNIPDIDPYEFNYWNQSYPNENSPALQCSLTHGRFIGFNQCNFTSYSLDMPSGKGKLYLTCPQVIIDSEYVFETEPNSLLDGILGGRVAHGEGNVKATFTDLLLKFDLDVSAYKKNGKTYLNFNKDSYTYELGDLSVHATQVEIGNKDVTKVSDEFINRNWQLMMALFGDRWLNDAFQVYRKYSSEIDSSMPASEYITSDLTPLLKDQQ